MKPINKIKSKIESKLVGQKLLSDRVFRVFMIAAAGMGWNMLYGIFNGVLGIVYGSVWFVTMCVYYLILGCMRLTVTTYMRGKKEKLTQRKMMTFNGIALIFLAVVLSGSVVLAFKYPVAKQYDEIVMISIATYTFVTAFFAIRNIIKAHKEKSLQMIALRNISLASVTASMLSLQRSMITTFGEGEEHFRYVMEGATGMGVFLIVLALGISMIVRGVRGDKLQAEIKGKTNNSND